MAKFILFLDRLVNLYLYYVVAACLLSFVPNINYNYPLFHFIFKSAGFYLIPPVFGFLIAPMLIMVVCVLISIGLGKIYMKYFADKEPKIIVLSKDEFQKSVELLNKQMKEDKKDDEPDIHN